MEPQPQVVADPYVRVLTSPNDWRRGPFVGSPTVARLPSGRLLFCHDLFGPGCNNDTTYLHASDDDGATWQPVAEVQGLFWPSLFCCASGTYAIGAAPGQGRAKGDLTIIRGTENGTVWSRPVALTQGKAVHRGNTGALVSGGRVTVSFEVAPQYSRPRPQTTTTHPVEIRLDDLDRTPHVLAVAEPGVFVPHCLVALSDGVALLHARVLGVDTEAGTLCLQPEAWHAVAAWPDSPANTPGPWAFAAGSAVTIASGTLGNCRDFWVMAADAPEGADLCDPAAWRISKAVANPATTHARVLADLFGLNFVPRTPDGTPRADHMAAWSGWLEGVLVRLEHPGGDGKIRNLMRIAAGATANISARLCLEATDEDLTLRFDRFAPDPGLGCTHGCVQYDAASKLYWLASNVNRDSTRAMAGEPTQERSNLALFYSRNCADWFMAGLVATSPDWVHSFHYPHFIIDGPDLLFAVRAHVESPLTEATVHANGTCTADHHNSNAATFHRVRDFRRLANLDFIRYR